MKLRENSPLFKKFSTEGKILNLEKRALNSGENSQLFQKFLTLGKTLNLGENSHLRRKF